jgi:hypothetical protein
MQGPSPKPDLQKKTVSSEKKHIKWGAREATLGVRGENRGECINSTLPDFFLIFF